MSNSLNRQALGMIIGLVIQYSLGMAINLFVEFPQSQEPAANWHFATKNILIMAHLILGTLLIIGAITLVVRATRAKSAAWRLPALCALISMIIAWLAGDTFVTTQLNILSYIMSLSFLAAIFSYTWGLRRSRVG